jgi:uncharacterized protein (TIGR03437 family)
MSANSYLRSLLLAGAVLTAPAVFGRAGGPPAAAGVPTDFNGRDCSACHSNLGAANTDPRGSFQIIVDRLFYTPGVKKRIRVKLEHPDAMRWGFELTARRASDTSIGAGEFTGGQFVIQKCGLTAADPPCAGEPQPQFVSQNLEGTFRNTRNGVEWEFEWNPPANEVGDIVLYAAGNAADGNGNNQNDRIYTTNITLKAEGACNLTRRPTVRSIGNAASFAREISPNALASVFGLDFEVAGRTRAVTSGDLVNGAFPQSLACVAVEVAGRRAPITYVQTDQVNFQVPAQTPSGNVPLVVILNPGRPNELRSDQATVTVNSHTPAFFTFNNRSIAALTSDFRVVADPEVVPGGVAARRGDVVILYGTGFGFSEPVFQAGEIPAGTAPLRDRITVTVGGTTLAASDILYAGLAPNLISGLYQFNIRIPQSAATGNVAVQISIGGVATPTTGSVIPVQ